MHTNKNSKGEHIFYTHILITLNTTILLLLFFFYKNKQYQFPFKLTMITVHFYLYNLSINETSYFQQALYNKAKNKNEIEMNKTNVTIFFLIYYFVHFT